ncbi:hypothetical protein AB4Y43_09585 [Paraburkholderia sp. BR10872]|uniref:hypothetical protein n=1 Tax=Paraburkholderia sp. BR10872 TaxID=3236989 RepID=UPI0034D2F7EF
MYSYRFVTLAAWLGAFAHAPRLSRPANASLDELRVLTLSVRRSADAHARDSGEEPHGGLTVSAGVDELQAQDSLAALMARADVALYVARSRGRDRVVAI